MHEFYTMPLLEGLPVSFFDTLFAGNQVQSMANGTTLFCQGEEVVGVYLIRSGVVKVFRTGLSGKETIVHFARAGSFVGEGACLESSLDLGQNAKGFHLSTALATTKVEVMFIPYALFVELLLTFHEFTLRMLKVLALRQRMLTHKIGAQGEQNALQRVAAYILHRSSMEANSDCIDFQASRENLANLLGLARETLSRQLSLLVEKNVVEIQGRMVRILHRDLLEQLKNESEPLKLYDVTRVTAKE